MEVLIPVVALGGLAMSMKDSNEPSKNVNTNKSKNIAKDRLMKAKEGYANMKQMTPQSYPTNKGKKVNINKNPINNEFLSYKFFFLVKANNKKPIMRTNEVIR